MDNGLVSQTDIPTPGLYFVPLLITVINHTHQINIYPLSIFRGMEYRGLFADFIMLLASIKSLLLLLLMENPLKRTIFEKHLKL